MKIGKARAVVLLSLLLQLVVPPPGESARLALRHPFGSLPWTAQSQQPGAQFGVEVSAAGDINGDGYGDVLIGAYLYDAGEKDEGAAFVYHGSPQGLAPAPAWVGQANTPQAHFGRAVATAGDVNGDGFSDIMIGAPTYSDNSADGIYAYVYVYHGSRHGLALTPSWSVESEQSGDRFGRAVGTAGDVNGDGFSDVIIGAYNYDHGEEDEGAVLVYHGTASGLQPSPAWQIEGNQMRAGLGWSVGTAGDINGDGFSDVIAGAPHYSGAHRDEGQACVYGGSPTGLAPRPLWCAGSKDSGSQFGRSVSTAGDVNGDGFSDVLVGARLFDSTEPGKEGQVFVYYGARDGLPAAPSWTAAGSQSLEFFGNTAATAGDVNGDGFSDIIIGAPGYTHPEQLEGRALVYYGSPTGLALSPVWQAESNQAGAALGFSVGSAGDINGDGMSDVIVGAYTYDGLGVDEGRTYVYAGAGPQQIPEPATLCLLSAGLAVLAGGQVVSKAWRTLVL